MKAAQKPKKAPKTACLAKKAPVTRKNKATSSKAKKDGNDGCRGGTSSRDNNRGDNQRYGQGRSVLKNK